MCVCVTVGTLLQEFRTSVTIETVSIIAPLCACACVCARARERCSILFLSSGNKKIKNDDNNEDDDEMKSL